MIGTQNESYTLYKAKVLEAAKITDFNDLTDEFVDALTRYTLALDDAVKEFSIPVLTQEITTQRVAGFFINLKKFGLKSAQNYLLNMQTNISANMNEDRCKVKNYLKEQGVCLIEA